MLGRALDRGAQLGPDLSQPLVQLPVRANDVRDEAEEATATTTCAHGNCCHVRAIPATPERRPWLEPNGYGTESVYAYMDRHRQGGGGGEGLKIIPEYHLELLRHHNVD